MEAISSLIRLGVPAPPYVSEVYNWTVVAPALAYSIASAPVDIPPQPIIGVEAGSKGRRVFRAFNVIAFKGGPDNPPVSVLLAVESSGNGRHNNQRTRTGFESRWSLDSCVRYYDTIDPRLSYRFGYISQLVFR